MERLVLASPLMPAIFSILMFIGILSPVTWSVPGYLPKVFAAALVFSVVSAYCITAFVEDTKD